MPYFLLCSAYWVCDVDTHNDAPKQKNVIEMKQICTSFGDHHVHTNLNLEVRHGEILGVIGDSGSGKSTLLREMMMLHRPDSGSIRVLDVDLATISDQLARDLYQRWGVMFQHGGLFGTLTIRANVGLPLREHTRLDDIVVDNIADWKIKLSGLQPESALLYPQELSGGMLKRASMARALVMDPALLFLDEPTAGLDPSGADGIDQLIMDIHKRYQSTIVMVTHDLDLLWQVTDRVAVLGEGRVLGIGSMLELSAMDHPIIRSYFDGPRGRSAQQQAHVVNQTSSLNI
jgi:phospholipid/cholesterol/gamma-HCH transport system ATP-binding protein